ncbi:hypothetical protein M8998_08660 [Sphingobacterium sp. lm-10]|uniref:DinB family protein n=1 Tax=Sphingobacterium sp. lm-10 TaxID=2944904 RepID=UPI00201FFBC6|nr:DinB family protein [Sphingobacterium sp. lm-10]MCL7988008.1 hypothetical protein [Sphingobacterium sp. lm-10]
MIPKATPIESSLKIIEGLHQRWVDLMKNLADKEFEKEFLHAENQQKVSLKTNIGIYAWHYEHHLAHIIGAKKIKLSMRTLQYKSNLFAILGKESSTNTMSRIFINYPISRKLFESKASPKLRYSHLPIDQISTY